MGKEMQTSIPNVPQQIQKLKIMARRRQVAGMKKMSAQNGQNKKPAKKDGGC